MIRTVEVDLQWRIAPSAGLATGIRLTRPARFDNQGEDWTEDAWSLVVDTQGSANEEGHQRGIARFLVRDAPQDWLTEGRRFTLFEGQLALADGLVTHVINDR